MIEIMKLYELVSHYTTLDTVKFIDLVNACVSELASKYGVKYVIKPENKGEKDQFFTYEPAKTVDDNINVYGEYADSIYNYILAAILGGDFSLFYQKAEYAYRTVWKKLAFGMKKSRDIW